MENASKALIMAGRNTYSNTITKSISTITNKCINIPKSPIRLKKTRTISKL